MSKHCKTQQKSSSFLTKLKVHCDYDIAIYNVQDTDSMAEYLLSIIISLQWNYLALKLLGVHSDNISCLSNYRVY